MLCLASKSPRRLQLLHQLGLHPALLEVDVPEQRLPGESPADYVRRVARDKAVAGLQCADAADAVVLGADTEVVLEDEVYGKPDSPEAAFAMLQRLSGRVHQVLSAVCVVAAGREQQVLQTSEVRFAVLDTDAIREYLDCGEWQGKAGAYAIQGRAGAFIAHLSGSFSGVMGLPLHETSQLLAGFGVRAGR
jgi:septum formation protein